MIQRTFDIRDADLEHIGSSDLSYSKTLASKTIIIIFQPKDEMEIMVKMVEAEGTCRPLGLFTRKTQMPSAVYPKDLSGDVSVIPCLW